MMTVIDSNARIPIICAVESTIASAEFFNPNFWSGASKGIAQSCLVEYSVLCHCVQQLTGMCIDPERHCQEHIEVIKQQWRTKKFDIGKVIIYSEQPDLHMRIEAFFSGIKTLLDLLVQMLSSEKIVGADVNGFHRSQLNIYGGKVLEVLKNNVISGRREVATKLLGLILEHKERWIDRAIMARDHLIHPQKGMQQLMFQIELVEHANSLVCVTVRPPEIDSEPIHQYAQKTLKQAQDFSSSFLCLLPNVSGSGSGVAPPI